VAAWTSATIVGDAESVVISHDAPTFWNQVPMFEATLAIHSQRKMVWRSGLQGERASAAFATPAALRPRELLEIVRGGCEEALSSLDQFLNILRLDWNLDLVIGDVPNPERPSENLMKSSVKLLGLSEPKPILGQYLSMTREADALTRQQSLSYVKASIVRMRGSEIGLTLIEMAFCSP